jgi:hypothetical protein
MLSGFSAGHGCIIAQSGNFVIAPPRGADRESASDDL